MSHYHCVVWIDHREAHVIHFNPDDAEESIIHPKSKHKAHLHHKEGVIGSGKTPPDDKYNQEVADAIKDAGEILIVLQTSADTRPRNRGASRERRNRGSPDRRSTLEVRSPALRSR